MAFKDGQGPIGEVWTTHSFIADMYFGIIFCGEINNTFTLTSEDTEFSLVSMM